MDKKKLKPLKELLDSVRDIDGFPIGTDEDILNLSDPPYYTACPNPYINDFIEEYGKPYDAETDTYERKPFVGDVSEGKKDFIYGVHSYHTKVPPKAIEHYIKHYTDEGDIVLDGFSGSGMLGIAASYLKRYAIVSDISTIASFMANNYNFQDIDYKKFETLSKEVLNNARKENEWIYKIEKTVNNENNTLIKTKNEIDFTVYSEIFLCPFCNTEYAFYDLAVDKESGKVASEFNCLHCNAEINKKMSRKSEIEYIDKITNEKLIKTKHRPVLISYFG